MSTYILAIVFPVLLAAAEPPPPALSSIHLQVHRIKTEEGMIRVAVYDDQENFNQEPIYAFAFPKANRLKDGRMDCQFELPPGNYAFSLLDDCNANNAMDYSKIGIPKEGFGFSNDAPIRFLKAPSFERCSLQLETGQQAFKIKMRYF